ncbi:hypothetical protein [uncultured Corynebacterium sp.]|uniref:hypothetical protein n=1 Tax=uncultured Corynebacterium sp. TaxID=159447 RepID=UPI0025E9EEEF|nr:hypothetical protein [uncultured Corynebacterium sp.]
MFYYYGRKKQLSWSYPEARYETIVEPFAGAAAYSLREDNWRKRIILVEKDHRVTEIWDWLVNEATPSQIEALPVLHPGERSSEFLHIVHAATKMAFKYKTIKVTPVLARNWEITRRVFIRDLHKVKHWEIISGDYTCAPDIEATWFIDPPYKGEGGMGYRFNSANLDYLALADWIKCRKGQVIACEGKEGDYLPFKPLTSLSGVAGKRSEERIWLNDSRDLIEIPPALFSVDSLNPSIENRECQSLDELQ